MVDQSPHAPVPEDGESRSAKIQKETAASTEGRATRWRVWLLLIGALALAAAAAAFLISWARPPAPRVPVEADAVNPATASTDGPPRWAFDGRSPRGSSGSPSNL